MVLILSGPPAAGKTTLGPLIAKQLDRCAVIDVDLVRAMVVQPHVAPWLGEAGLAQLRLGAQNACALARNFVEAGYPVVILDVLIDETAAIYHRLLADCERRIVLLLPTLASVIERNRARGQWLTDDEVRLLYAWEQDFSQYDQRIDNTDLSAHSIAAVLKASYFSR